ncbi:hypothetical protein [Bosea sp. TND4EK4]|uniref:hypothetical protein n=1 Tax=Bosea sp. TND4EK4 TaxID=1907408 RepID=UPI000953F921|nr:hypothetical protein [Bosea sp. TND4EK4]SIR26418.1 hypothetical protein SAMN05880592_11413 [Bosea sp. TND4EK4]
MTEARTGRAVVTSAIVVMAVILNRMGVLQKGGVGAAVQVSAAIAMVLFIEQ